MGGFLLERQLIGQLSSEKVKKEILYDVEAEDVACDFSLCAPKCCQRFRNIKVILFWLCWCGFAQAMTTTGFVNGLLSTMERRYGMTSTESGTIPSMFDVGNFLVVMPMTYYGGSWRRLRATSLGLVLMSISCFLFALPQATSGKYIYETPTLPLCYRYANNTSYDDHCHSSQGSLHNYKYVFWLASLLMGCGNCGLQILVPAYLDENLLPDQAALYIGIYYTTNIIGASFGYVFASTMLNLYVDIGSPHPGLTNLDKEFWVGAWWICFIVAGIMLLIPFIPLFGFPKELPKTAAIRRQKKSEAFGNTQALLSNNQMFNFTKNLKILLKNPTYMFMNLSVMLDAVLINGFTVFGPKFLESVFQLSTSFASSLFGLFIGPLAAIGAFCGGFVINRLKLSVTNILKMQFVVGACYLPLSIAYILRCDFGGTAKFGGIAGITTSYDNNETLTKSNLTTTCNADCKCLSDSSHLKLSCASNRLTYFSPCYAGCTTYSSLRFGNCSCISKNETMISTEFLENGSCTRKCGNLPFFMIAMGMSMFLLIFNVVPTASSTLRCVPDKQKTFALGFQSTFGRIGAAPASIVIGGMFDFACTLWYQKCGIYGNCAFYSESSVRLLLTLIGFVVKFISVITLLIAWLSYKSPNKQNETDTHDVSINQIDATVNDAYVADG